MTFADLINKPKKLGLFDGQSCHNNNDNNCININIKKKLKSKRLMRRLTS